MKSIADPVGVVTNRYFGPVLSEEENEAFWTGAIILSGCHRWDGEKVNTEEYVKRKLESLKIRDERFLRGLKRRIARRERARKAHQLSMMMNDFQRVMGRYRASGMRFSVLFSLAFLLTSLVKMAGQAVIPRTFKLRLPQPRKLSAEERLKICETCVYFTGRRCRLCGCFMKAKARIPTEVCPIGRW